MESHPGVTPDDTMAVKAVFMDRDDTLARDVPYCDDPAKFQIYDDVPAAIARLNDAGYMTIVITNQSGINRGYFTEDVLSRIHARMVSDIESGGGHIDDIFFCPHTPDEKCSCRKPEIGMGLAAIRRYGIDPGQSFMIGDHDKDMEFGRRLGCKDCIKVGSGLTFSDAVDMILGKD
jgi:histidinol-phosphate phosphatase family protein